LAAPAGAPLVERSEANEPLDGLEGAAVVWDGCEGAVTAWPGAAADDGQAAALVPPAAYRGDSSERPAAPVRSAVAAARLAVERGSIGQNNLSELALIVFPLDRI